MIAVIADDLTGAAEIGGIALRHGLTVVIDTKVHTDTRVDVLVIATDCRSRVAADAAQLIRKTTRELLKLQPEFIFKKTDSLLRGHVAEELLAQMEVSGKKRTLLIPANPVLNRTIRAGIYYAGNQPLNESDLADAARKKISTSAVLDLLGNEFSFLSSSISLTDELPASGVMIGNTLSEPDLDKWAQRIDAGTIPAGSGGFFNAVLKNKVPLADRVAQPALAMGRKAIYICGSAFPLSKATVKQAKAEGRYVAYMPASLFCLGTNLQALIQQWMTDIVHGLAEKEEVVIAVDELQCSYLADIAKHIRSTMATVVQQVLQQTTVDELLIEGGATAAAVIDTLGITRLFPQQELAQGVLRMKTAGERPLFITMKPGSYQWPDTIWKPAFKR